MHPTDRGSYAIGIIYYIRLRVGYGRYILNDGCETYVRKRNNGSFKINAQRVKIILVVYPPMDKISNNVAYYTRARA